MPWEFRHVADGDSKAANDVSVQSKFTAFFSVVIGVHSVMFVFALVFIFSEDGDAPQFAECVSTGSLFREFYPEVPTAGVNLTLPTANGHLGGNYTCVAQFSDSRMFISAISFGIASLTAGLLCHRCLPVQHPAIPYIDAVVIVCSVPGACERNFPHRLRSLPWPVLPDANAAGRPGECVLASRLMKGCVRVSAYACAGEK